MKNLLAGASLLPFLCAGIVAHAADATSGSGEVSEVIVTGTRQVGVKAEDSAAPIQVVGSRNLRLTGASDLAISLTSSVPSLNIQTTGGDAAAVNIQAALRGLSPNDTLVLVDGKRRHGTANLAVDGGSPYSGSATTDLSFIPIGAIDHVEVLTDGAAAQYGTDAIAGVINIITKKGGAGSLDITGGQYYGSNGTQHQGLNGDISINKGILIGDKGYLNFTFENHYHDFSVQGCGDSRFQNVDCSLKSGLTFPNSNVTKYPAYPHENQLNGDPQFNLYNAFITGGYQIVPEAEIYMIGSYSERSAQHFENYRTPSKISGTPLGSETPYYPLPLGFDPKEKFDEKDYSITGGVRGEVEGFHYDLSGTYGGNSEQIYTIDSANAVEFAQLQSLSTTPIVPQTAFYDGEYKASELTLNADFSRDFAVGMASPLSVAFGGEYRRDTYGIGAGEPSSYNGGGAQSFGGYTPQDAGFFSRSNVAGYIDLALDPIKNLHLEMAGRFEHYSDFGDAEVGKLTMRYDFNPMFALRATVSNGFRAPTLAEEHYSGTNVSPYSAEVQLPPNSTAAQGVGLGALRPEQSQNYSVGFVAHPIDNLQVTLDAYQINLHSRILASGFLYGSQIDNHGVNQIISQGVLDAIGARGVILDTGLSYTGISVFNNSANTRTQGIELTANYATDFGDYGHVDWTLGANYNKTQITKTFPLPADLANANPPPGTVGPQVSYFTPQSASALMTATPREKVILQAYYTNHKFSMNLRETIYGDTSQWSANNSFYEQLGTTGITDLDFGYQFTKWIKVDVGANNLFNVIPTRAPISAGGRVYDVPYGFSPWGINGGYYYGRVVVAF